MQKLLYCGSNPQKVGSMLCKLHETSARDKHHVPTGFYNALQSMGMEPGLEFKVALEEADKLNARYVALHTFHSVFLVVSCHALLLYEPCIAVATASPLWINAQEHTSMLICLSWVALHTVDRDNNSFASYTVKPGCIKRASYTVKADVSSFV